jgi:uncharacterized spore protein YtfJ
MNEGINDLLENVHKEAEARSQTLQRLLSAADSAAVFGQPVSSGDYTVIPAAEIAAGGGFGSGMGFGSPRMRRSAAPAASGEPAGEGSSTEATVEGAGGGGGGGGGAMGRPVAVIVVGPDGVEVKPVLDLTKISLTALGAFGAAALFSIKMKPWRENHRSATGNEKALKKPRR